MSKSTYIIGEIGQNHNGSVDIAKLIVDMVSRPVTEDLFGLHLKGIDAVKLTRRDLSQELSASQMAAPYNSPNAFAETYGAHREVLELNDQEHFEIYKCAKSQGLDFVETLCALGAMSLLDLFEPDYLKVASRDITNLPLLDAMASAKIPMILSTGMAGKPELDSALETIYAHHDQVSILHCVSEYPTQPNNVNLNSIKYLQNHYGKHSVGFSDHTIGISAPLAAVAMGAEIIEKHITLDRRMKGTDQQGSLAPDGVRRMVRDIRLLEMSLGTEEIFIDPSVESARKKLERSVASRSSIAKGEVIKQEDLHMLSPGDGFKWSERSSIIGKQAKQDIPANEVIYPQMLA